MNPEISMHHLTLADISVMDFIPVAARAGCSAVSLFVNNLGYDLPEVTPQTVRDVRKALDDNGLTATATADFILTAVPGGGVHQAYLDVTAGLGARYASAVVGEIEDERSIAAIASFSEAARNTGLRVVIEFLRFTPGCPDFVKCEELVRKTGSDNVGILLDMTHFTRSGGTLEQLRSVDTSLVEYVHLADGRLAMSEEAMGDEVVFDRMVPGEGEFPIVGILSALPEKLLYEIEAPSRALQSLGLDAEARARRYVESAHRIIAEAAAYRVG